MEIKFKCCLFKFNFSSDLERCQNTIFMHSTFRDGSLLSKKLISTGVFRMCIHAVKIQTKRAHSMSLTLISFMSQLAGISRTTSVEFYS
jgi:hypothetical protein